MNRYWKMFLVVVSLYLPAIFLAVSRKPAVDVLCAHCIVQNSFVILVRYSLNPQQERAMTETQESRGYQRESEVNCEVRFTHDLTYGTWDGPFQGYLRLFEHSLGDSGLPIFWYGVLSFNQTLGEMEISTAAPVPGIQIHVNLPDGRAGIARCENQSWRLVANRLPVVGVHQLVNH